MFDKAVIKEDVQVLCEMNKIEYDERYADIGLRKAIEYGAKLRGCSVDYLEQEETSYNSALANMTVSFLALYDKFGMTTASQNGVMNTYENGNIFQEQDCNEFIPLLRGV